MKDLAAIEIIEKKKAKDSMMAPLVKSFDGGLFLYLSQGLILCYCLDRVHLDQHLHLLLPWEWFVWNVGAKNQKRRMM